MSRPFPNADRWVVDPPDEHAQCWEGVCEGCERCLTCEACECPHTEPHEEMG